MGFGSNVVCGLCFILAHLFCSFLHIIGVPLLMSDTFYGLLDSTNKYRCRKLDQLILLSSENDSLTDPREILDSGEKMSIVSKLHFTFHSCFYLPGMCWLTCLFYFHL